MVFQSCSPTVYLFAGHKMGIHGGGSTCAQLSRAYARAGYSVVYIAPDCKRTELVDGLSIKEIPNSGFDPKLWLADATEDDILHVALPCKKAMDALRRFPGKALYHCRDNWDVWNDATGKKKPWSWYVPGLEKKFIRMVPVSYAVSPALREYVGAAKVLPNAYDPNIFRWKDRCGPVRDVVLWGFSGGFIDRELLSEVASRTPFIDYTLIGGKPIKEPERVGWNVVYLGGKLITELPSIAAEADLGIIIRQGDTANYMCPIKAWEYLGAGLRFVSAGPDYPNRDYNPACINSGSTDPNDIARTIIEAYDIIPELTKEDALPHTWDKRVETILADLEVCYG